MKTPTKPTAPRMPRARVMYASTSSVTKDLRCHDLQDHRLPKEKTYGDWDYTHPCAVIPTATARQARKLAAFWNLTEEEQLKILACLIHGVREGMKDPQKSKHYCGNDALCAEAVLADITGGRT